MSYAKLSKNSMMESARERERESERVRQREIEREREIKSVEMQAKNVCRTHTIMCHT